MMKHIDKIFARFSFFLSKTSYLCIRKEHMAFICLTFFHNNNII